MELIKCTKCKKEKELNLFYKDSSKRGGVCSWCKECSSTKRKGCPILAKKRREAFEKDPEKRREIRRNSERRNMESKLRYKRERRMNDDLYRFKENLRTRIRTFVNRSSYYRKGSKTESLIGTDYFTAYRHIESLFTDGMSWDKVGKDIHIDHIIPLSSAKTKEEVEKLFHYKNLQPLWAVDNLKKGSKIL